MRSTPEGLLVHPYGSRKPSTTDTDFVIGTGRALNFSTSMTGIVFEDLTVTYSGTVYTMGINGKGNVFRNMRWVGVPLTSRGSGNRFENYTVTHVHFRDPSGDWSWHYKGNGTAAILYGADHVLVNGHMLHSWNNDISTENAFRTVIDGLRMHGAANHCGIGKEGSTTSRNTVVYNCQDYWWTKDNQNMMVEHAVMPGGIGLEADARPLGPITVRNSIFSGTFTFVRGPLQYCTWEKGSVLENSVIAENASIERCADNKTYPLKEYLARCASGEFTDCLTVRNVRWVKDFEAWKTVIKDGMWSAALADSWDVSLVPGSPALNIGASTTDHDILGIPRPQPAGGLSDAGIYEVTATGDGAPGAFTITGAPGK